MRESLYAFLIVAVVNIEATLSRSSRGLLVHSRRRVGSAQSRSLHSPHYNLYQRFRLAHAMVELHFSDGWYAMETAVLPIGGCCDADVRFGVQSFLSLEITVFI